MSAKTNRFSRQPISKQLLSAMVALGLLTSLTTTATGPAVLPPKSKFQLFLLVGQSNMAGRGMVEEQDRTPHPRVLMLNKAGEWVPAIDPMHFDKSAAGVGLGKSFAQILADANPDVTIGLIPCAVGGSPIDTWRPGEFYEPTKSHPWDDALRRAKLALQFGELQGILWHQGESDSKAGLAEAYEAKLHDLIRRFRTELGAMQVPFLAGQMGRFSEVPWDDARKLVDQAHRNLPARVPMAAFVSAENLRHKGDKVHFDAASYRELGKRFASTFLELSGKAKVQHPEPSLRTPTLRPHPDAGKNTHSPGEVDKPELVRFIVGDPGALPGIVVDETAATLTGKWQYSTHTPPYVGLGYLHDLKEGKGGKSVTFTPDLPRAGRYEVRLAHCYNVRRATNTPVTIRHAGGETMLRINQQETPPHGHLFRTLGTFKFEAGRAGWVRVASDGTEGKYVIADAVQWLPAASELSH